MPTFDEPRVRKRPDVALLTQESNERKEAAHLRDAYDEYLQRQRRKRLRRDVRSSDVSDVKSSDVSDVTPYRHRFLQQRFRPVWPWMFDSQHSIKMWIKMMASY